MRSLKLTSFIFRISLEVANIAAIFFLLVAIILYFIAPSKLTNYALLIGVDPVDGVGSILLFCVTSYVFVIGFLAVILEVRENAKENYENSEQIIELLRSISTKISNYESRMARQSGESRKAETASHYEAVYQNMKSVQQQTAQSNRNAPFRQNAEPVFNQSAMPFEKKI